MKKVICYLLFISFLAPLAIAQNFTMEQVTSYPFPSELVCATSGDKIAWAMIQSFHLKINRWLI